MIANQGRLVSLMAGVALGLGIWAPTATAQQSFQLHSTTFSNDSELPISMILNNQVNGQNTCSATGAAGYDESPELYWTGIPRGTQSFVVVLYDVTASFTHWGMYNIPGGVTQLPENAGKAGSPYGLQIENDFDLGQQYDGPCPPANVAPDTHQYVFTVYALSGKLSLPGSSNFPANGETLYHALILASQKNEILGEASLTGLYSSTPPAN
ncbi:MAG TPA: YbhB/YbcL family Raf kinase inhibitor-like protein [Acidobacteriaceae bacterium]|nr:YbhB/YbcL family Raf kinase inhibitor-like protein [Acidobacteriaceae bacterium]